MEQRSQFTQLTEIPWFVPAGSQRLKCKVSPVREWMGSQNKKDEGIIPSSGYECGTHLISKDQRWGSLKVLSGGRHWPSNSKGWGSESKPFLHRKIRKGGHSKARVVDYIILELTISGEASNLEGEQTAQDEVSRRQARPFRSQSLQTGKRGLIPEKSMWSLVPLPQL